MAPAEELLRLTIARMTAARIVQVEQKTRYRARRRKLDEIPPSLWSNSQTKSAVRPS